MIGSQHIASPHITFLVLRWLNQWYRRGLKPHVQPNPKTGVYVLRYCRRYKVAQTVQATFLFVVFLVLFTLPVLTEGLPPTTVLFLRVGWVGIFCLAIVLMVQTYGRQWRLSDEGVSANVFGHFIKSMRWSDVATAQLALERNEMTLVACDGNKLTIELSVDGVADLASKMETACLPIVSHQTVRGLQEFTSRTG